MLLTYYPSNTTESLQEIDAGYGRSIRCAIGRLLDVWLMADDNLEKWEKGKLTVSDRRMLMSNLVTKVNDIALKNDNMRVGCFICTGGLIEFTKSDADKLIKPQGIIDKIVIPDSYTGSNNLDNNEYVLPSTSTNSEEIENANDNIYDENETSGNVVYDLEIEEAEESKVQQEEAPTIPCYESGDDMALV